jgi:hypothetical protein
MLNDDHQSNNMRNNQLLNFSFIVLIVNFILDILITLVNIFVRDNYLNQLISFSIQNILIFVILMIFVLIASTIPIIIGQKYKNWDESKQTQVFFNLLAVFSIISISIVSVIIYFNVYTSYSVLMNPFLVDKSSLLYTLGHLWWFFSINLGLILIFLLYIYLES